MKELKTKNPIKIPIKNPKPQAPRHEQPLPPTYLLNSLSGGGPGACGVYNCKMQNGRQMQYAIITGLFSVRGASKGKKGHMARVAYAHANA